MKRVHLIRVFFGLLVVLVLPSIVSAQSQSTGTVAGTVSDATGAIVPGAEVELVNKATSDSRPAVTSEAGRFSFTFLPPGDYTLTVSLPGFKRLVRDDIPVNVTQTVDLDLMLELGSITEQVTVAGTAPLVQKTQTALGHVVEEEMLTDLPLSSRNFTQIIGLTPGVQAPVADAGALGRNSVNVSANGARLFENSVILNGLIADNPMSLGFDDDTDKTGVPVPSPDSIQEFKLQTGLYDAETGRQAGAVLTVVTKTGGNELHGSVYEFLRNENLNANDFFSNRSNQEKPVLKQNQFGGSLGGPIIKDRMFFFFSYQGTRQRNGVSSASSRNTFLPPLGQDRSAATLGALYGGQAGVFGGAAVAADGSNINPVALNLLNAQLPGGGLAIPSPQVILPSGAGFSAFSVPARFTEDQVVANYDYVRSANNRFAGKVFYSDFPADLPFSRVATVPGFGENDLKSNLNVSVSNTYTFSPTAINELRLGYSRMFMDQKPIEPLEVSSLGMTPAVAEYPGIPLIQVSGLFSIGPETNNDQRTIIHGYELADTFSFSKGRHNLRIGGSVNPYLVTRTDIFLKRGRVNFLSFPDFLLGMSGEQNGTPFSNVSRSQVSNGIGHRHPRFKNLSAFLQDDFRVNSRLTLNLGLRWQFNSQQQDKHGRNAGFDRRLAVKGFPPPEGTLVGNTVPSNAEIDFPAGATKLNTKTLVDSDNNLAFAPRLGVAWRPVADWDTFVMRAGYGIFWASVAGTITEQAWFGPWYIWLVAGGANAAGATFQEPYVTPAPPTSAFPVFVPYTLGSNVFTLVLDPTMKQPYSQHWSLNFQYGVGSYLFEAGYVGSKSTHIVSWSNPNQALLADSSNPVNGETTNTVQNRNLRVPVIGFSPGGFLELGSHYDAHHHGLQMSVKKRYSNGLSFLSSYTWSKTLDNVGDRDGGRNQPLGGGNVQDFYNRAANNGLASFDRTHRFVTSYVWELPRLGNASGVVDALINGWSLAGVTTVQSGRPFDVNDRVGGTIFGISSSRAEFAAGRGPADARLSGSTQSRLDRYFNTSVFGDPPTIGGGTGFGNSGRSILKGPGQINFDMSFGKSFAVGGINEDARLEFRSEFFNLFNTPQFANPANQLRTGSFGFISNTIAAPRIIQFALKYSF